jgi:tRNA threonylcarbamoyladenosine biosynthesis protein TsaE
MIPLDLPDERATARLAAALARRARAGDVIALEGELGTGKTTFARAFIRARGTGREEVPSPTFTLVQVYDEREPWIWHFDLYRIEKPEEAFELGIEEAFLDGISLIEWPERLGALLPRRRLLLRLFYGDRPASRRAELVADPRWKERLETIAAAP